MAACKAGHEDPPRSPNGTCRTCAKTRAKEWRENNRERYLEIVKGVNERKRDRERSGVLDAYGRACTCCGESEEAFLVIDHIDGGGNEHRRSMGSTPSKRRSGSRTYEWLRKRGYPPGYQTLCANCNMAKERPGGCPHRREKEAPRG